MHADVIVPVFKLWRRWYVYFSLVVAGQKLNLNITTLFTTSKSTSVLVAQFLCGFLKEFFTNAVLLNLDIVVPTVIYETIF